MKIQMPFLHPAQREVFDDLTRFQVLVCGRRWGKTRLAVVKGLAELLNGKRVWWVAPTYSVSGIGWRLLKTVIGGIAGAEVREADRMVRFGATGEFWFKTAERPDNLRGEGLDLLLMDEADFIDEEVWTEVLRPALSDRLGRAMFISTPKVENGWFHKLFKEGQQGNTTVRSWSYPSSSNPFLDAGEIEAARGSLPSLVFRREYGAEFVSAAGTLVQSSWMRYVGQMPAGLTLSMGVDLAISQKDTADYTAIVVMGKSQGGQLYVLDVHRERMTFDQILQTIKAKAQQWQPKVIGIEQVQFQAAVVQELLRTTSLPVKGMKADKDKTTRFLPLQARYEQGLIFHLRSLPSFFDDELLSFPVGKHDDMVDALSCAYASMSAVGLVQLAQRAVTVAHEASQKRGHLAGFYK
jgi:predicted phage terminase large subunit-like protein